MKQTTRLLIVGAGPAGLTAAIQAGRDGLEPLLVSREAPGGLVRSAHRLDNLPGFPQGISGPDYADLLTEQARRFGVLARPGAVRTLGATDGGFRARVVWTDAPEQEVCPHAVILATGSEALSCPWEIPHGLRERVHRDARTLPVRLANARVVVIGGGETALDIALTAVSRGAEVRVLLRGASPKAPVRLCEEARAAGVRIDTDTACLGLAPNGPPLRVLLSEHDDRKTVEAEHLVMAIGRRAHDGLLDAFWGLWRSHEVRTDVPGLFLAGDLIHGTDRFAAIAAGDGLLAARLAGAYLGTASFPTRPHDLHGD